MPEDDAPMPLAQKLKALRQTQFALGQIAQPFARACGLTQEELAVLANEGLVEVFFSKDEGPDLDRYHIARILPAGFAILSQAHVAEPDPLKISVVLQHKSVLRRIYEGTRSGLWDLIKIALGAICGGFVTWYLTHHPK